MKNDMQLLQSLLDKYRFTRPIPPGIRGRILARKRRNFVAVMKKLGRYNALLGAFLVVYFLLRRIGIVATLKQCGIVLITASLFTAAGVSVGGYIAVKHILDAPAKVEESVKDDSTHPEPVLDAEKDRPAPYDVPPPLREVKNAIVFQPFDGMNASTGEISRVSGMIQSELIRIRGSKNIISSRGLSPEISTRLLLIGTVRKMGVSYAITAKVIDRESGKIHFAATEEARSDTLSFVSKKIAKEISDNIE